MKKNIFAIVASAILAFGMNAYAQPQQQKKEGGDSFQRPTPEQMVEHQAARIATELALSDDASAKFIATYKAFKAEQTAINKQSYKKPKDHEMTDAEVEAKIKSDFEISHAILDLREKYYYEFRTFMNPKQIQKMYQLEKHNSNSARSELYRRQGNPAYPQKGPQGSRGGHQGHPQGFQGQGGHQNFQGGHPQGFQGQHQGYGQPQGDPKKTQL